MPWNDVCSEAARLYPAPTVLPFSDIPALLSDALPQKQPFHLSNYVLFLRKTFLQSKSPCFGLTHDVTEATKRSQQCTFYWSDSSTVAFGWFSGRNLLFYVKARLSFDIPRIFFLKHHSRTSSRAVAPLSFVGCTMTVGWEWCKFSRAATYIVASSVGGSLHAAWDLFCVSAGEQKTKSTATLIFTLGRSQFSYGREDAMRSEISSVSNTGRGSRGCLLEVRTRLMG
ncbi:hypothetical protein DPSP01_001482 [Paraphaeosphaeria sporulosa]